MNQKHYHDLFSEFVVGIFMLAVLSLMVYFTIIISGVDVLFGKSNVTRIVEFSNVGGLKPRDSVIYRGLKIGLVSDILLGDKTIKVELEIDKNARIYEGYTISVASTSVLGGNYLLIEEGNGALLPETTVLHGLTPTDWMRDLGNIVHNLQELTSEGGLQGIVSNMSETVENVNTLVARVERGEGTLGKFFSTNDTVYTDIAQAALDIRSIATKLNTGTNSASALINDDGALYADIRTSMNNIQTLSSRIAAGQGTLGKLLAEDDTIYADVRASVASIKCITERIEKGEGLLGRLSADRQLADNAAKLMENLQQLSNTLAQGQGTLGKLTTDDEMYNEIQGMLKDMRQVIDNYRDTTPITAFGSLIMGGL